MRLALARPLILRTVLAVPIAALGVWLLAFPGAAAAKPGYEVQDRGLRLTMSARTGNGYVASVQTNGHREVVLTLARGSVLAVYRTTGRVSRRGIEARFGDLGWISVRFQGKRRPFELLPGLDIPLPPGLALPHRDCRGRKPVREVGGFRGTIRFVGERGFTRLRARHARGEVDRFYRRVCKRGSRSFGPFARAAAKRDAPRLNLLLVSDRSPHRIVSFEGGSFDLGPGNRDLEELFGSIAIASVRERRPGLRIVRAAIVIGDAGSMIVSRRGATPERATVTLPKPFGGTAEYTKETGSPATWIGSLTAWLPGAGTVHLTGPEFAASLCRLKLEDVALDNPCLRRSGVPLPGAVVAGTGISAQISGSQSQLFGDARLSWSR